MTLIRFVRVLTHPSATDSFMMRHLYEGSWQDLYCLIPMSEYVAQGGPCRRQCDVDMKTLTCNVCGLSYRRADDMVGC